MIRQKTQDIDKKLLIFVKKSDIPLSLIKITVS